MAVLRSYHETGAEEYDDLFLLSPCPDMEEAAWGNEEGRQETAPISTYSHYYPYCKPILLANPYEGSNWLVDGILPMGITMLSAESGVGKSFLCVSLATAVAYQSHWLERQHKVRKNGYVLYLAGEDQQGLQLRFLGAFEHAGLDARQAVKEQKIHILDGMPFRMVLGYGGDLDTMTLSGYLDELDKLAASGDREYPVLTIVDTLGNFLEGSVSNDADATAFMHCMQEIQRRTGGAVLFAHHERKYAKFDGTGDNESFTGSTRFRDLSDYAYRLRESGSCPQLWLVNYKARWSESGKKLPMKKVPHPILLPEVADADGRQPSTLVVEMDYSQPEEQPKPLSLTKKQSEDLELIKSYVLWNKFEPTGNEARIELEPFGAYLKDVRHWNESKLKNNIYPNKGMLNRFLADGWYELEEEGKTLTCVNDGIKDHLRKWRIQKGYQLEAEAAAEAKAMADAGISIDLGTDAVADAETAEGTADPADAVAGYQALPEPEAVQPEGSRPIDAAGSDPMEDYSLFGGDGLDDDDDTDTEQEYPEF